MKMIEIEEFLGSLYPQINASSFDYGKIGLQFGNHQKEIKKIMLCLDGTLDVCEEAVKNNVDLLICHHPFMFTQMLNLDYNSTLGKKLKLLLENNLCIYAMHTNFDASINGMNDILAKHLQLKNITNPLGEYSKDSFLRVGECDEVSLNEYINHVKTTFNQPFVRVVGSLDTKITKVGIVGGSGGSCLYDAVKAGCDVLITGEIKHNVAFDALDAGICLIEVNHGIEAFYKEDIKKILEENFQDLDVILSEKDIDPIKNL